MLGMSTATGAPLDGDAHLAQSVADILTTPIGTRTMRRDYGSALFELIDQPVTKSLPLRLYAATAMAIRRWEPRLAISRMKLALDGAGHAASLTIEGSRTDGATANSLVTLTVPLRRSPA